MLEIVHLSSAIKINKDFTDKYVFIKISGHTLLKPTSPIDTLSKRFSQHTNIEYASVNIRGYRVNEQVEDYIFYYNYISIDYVY